MLRSLAFASLFCFGCAEILDLGGFTDQQTSGGGGQGEGGGPTTGGNGGTGEGGTGANGGTGGGTGGEGATGDPGEVLWGVGVGSPGPDGVNDVAMTPSGEIYVLGSGKDTFTFSIGPDSVTTPGMWLAKLSSDGEIEWAQSFPTADTNFPTFYVYGVAVDADQVVIAAYVEEGDTMSFPDGPLGGVVVASFAPDGTHQWSKSCGGSTNYKAEIGGDVALDSQSNIIVGSLTNGPMNCAASGTGRTGYVVSKLDPTGTQLWARGGGGIGYDRAMRLAVDSGDNVVVTGDTNGADFGGGEIDGAIAAKLAPNGNHVWSKRITTTFGAHPRSITTTSNAGILIGGNITDATNFGGGPLSPAGTADAFLLLLSGSGDHVDSQNFGNGIATVDAIIAGPGNDVTIGGNFDGSMPLGATTLTPAGGRDAYLVHLDPNWQAVEAFNYGGGMNDAFTSFAADADVIIAGGTYIGSPVFGAVQLTAFGDVDAMVLGIAR